MNVVHDVILTSETLQRPQSSFTIDSLMSTTVRYETPQAPMTKILTGQSMMTSLAHNAAAMTSSCGVTVPTPGRHLLNSGVEWSKLGNTNSGPRPRVCYDYLHPPPLHSTNATDFPESSSLPPYRHHIPQQPLAVALPRQPQLHRQTTGTSQRHPHPGLSSAPHNYRGPEASPRFNHASSNTSTVGCRSQLIHRFTGIEDSQPPSPSTCPPSLDALLPPQYAANLPLYAAWLLSERGNTYLNSLGSDNSLLFPFHKRKRFRTSFNPPQLLRLEEAFQTNRYMVGQERRDLADSLGLTETQIKVWFQNRRTKQKKDPSGSGGSSENGNDDDEIQNMESSSLRDCGESLTSSSSRSENDDVDIVNPRHPRPPGLLPATTGLLRALEPINHAHTMMSCSYRMM